MRPAHLVPAAVVLLALGGIAGAAQFAAPAAPGPAHAATPRQVAVTSAARACPPVAGGGSGTVAFVAGSPAASRPAPGQADLAPLPLAGAALKALSPISPTEPGALSMLTIPAAQSASKQGASQQGAASKAAAVLQGWS